MHLIKPVLAHLILLQLSNLSHSDFKFHKIVLLENYINILHSKLFMKSQS